VSYAYEFTEPALKQFQQLDSWLGEETLDELETLAANPPQNRLRSTTGFVYDFVRIRGVETIYVFLTIVPNIAAHQLSVTNVGVFVRH
jgi:hypothetical protein